ncbi:MAG: hypothetical protein JXQ96_12710 [Cyclobacteriaceae bacterium]
MKKLFNILTAFLALTVLMGSTGISLHKHHCMGMVRDISFFHAPDTCGGEMEMNDDMGCCHNTSEEYKADDYHQITVKYQLAPKFEYIASFNFEIESIASAGFDKTQFKFLNYKPPLIAQDLPILVQSFLL